jgi:protoporphyrin/coproporphyrin ferrochelatase
MSPPAGVLVMAHGTPGRAEEIAPFYTRIRRGRPPTAEQLADLERRYEAIGGLSPLTERTRAQVDALRAVLEARAPGRYRVAYGAKHADPLIEEGAAALDDLGADPVIALVLTPHGSSLGSGEYFERARRAVEPERRLIEVPPWYAAPALVELLAGRVRQAVAAQGLDHGRAAVVFTAHSLPERVRQLGDTYPEQLADSAQLVAQAAGLDQWLVAWQSAGRTPEPWLGPDVRDVIRELAGGGGTDGVVVCPIGFVADHLEVLYDLDVEAAAEAASCGLAFTRTASLNDEPRFIGVLADAVQAAAGKRA